MPQFKKYKLGEVIELKRGYDLPQQDRRRGNIPIYSSSGLSGFHDQAKAKGPGVITGRYGTLGELFYTEVDYWPHNTTLYVKDFKGNDPKFIYYFIKTLGFSTQNDKTSVPGLNRNHLHEMDVFIPSDLPTQTRIAAILSSLDDKIELNRRTNATLEAMAQTLFKKYFVDDIDPDNLPDGWRYEKVESLFDISIGRTPPRVQREWFSNNHEDVKWISIKDMGNSGTYIFDTSEYLTKEAVKKFNVPVIPDNTVVLSFKLTVGRVAITTEKMLSNEAIAHFIPKKSTYLTPEYIFLFLKNFEYDSLGNTSSIATAVNSQTIKGINILVPDIEITNNFSSSVVALFKRIKTNQEEIKTLSQIRDSLLPKLMSGEIEVSAAENELVS
ncbi:restriction endonuclease subunit S [Lacibacter sp. MH-610]|uniref:restriction endonuclease subunit S n=1 Tax=Lacibacter sp. MH-610 TaxID=3020883 RepID=UPI0038924810